MPSDPALFSFIVDFKPGEGDPRRVFRAADALISAFEALDAVLIVPIGYRIQPALRLEEVTAGSLKVVLRSILKSLDDDALKSLDWKKIVGLYLVQGKQLALRFLDELAPSRPDLEGLKGDIRQLASVTGVRHLPDYADVADGLLIGSLDRVQEAKRLLLPDDCLFIEYQGERQPANLRATGLTSEIIPPDALDERRHFHEMVLGVRKPDFLRETMWTFSSASATITAPVLDQDWLNRFHRRTVRLMPGDALRCLVEVSYSLDRHGRIVERRFAVLKVYEVLPGDPDMQLTLPV